MKDVYAEKQTGKQETSHKFHAGAIGNQLEAIGFFFSRKVKYHLK